MQWNCTRKFLQKITETALLPRWAKATDKSQYGGHITHQWNRMFWKGSLSWSSLSEQFLWCLKTFCHFTAIFSFLTQATLYFSDVLHKDKNSSKRVNFDGVDFCECHSEKVMFLLMLSVYVKLRKIILFLTEDANFPTLNKAQFLI